MRKEVQGWLHSNTGVIVFLIIFFPIGLYSMWKYSGWSKLAKWTITGLLATFVLFGDGINRITVRSNSNKQISNEPISSVEPVVVEPSVLPSVVPVEDQKESKQYAIAVASEIVKEVGGKYRYFFSISNKDAIDYSGKVKIVGLTGIGVRVISYEVDFSGQPLKSGLSQSVFAEANTGPSHVWGENGVDKFTYTGILDGQEVAAGEGSITDKYESL